jgi:hypothetical protein
MRTFALAFLFSFFTSIAFSQDSCTVFWPGTTTDQSDSSLAWNPDYAHVDTCGVQPPYRTIYCRSSYHLTFDWRVINSPVASDTALVYEWTDIDTLYPSIRSAFQSLETALGHFTLTKAVSDIADTSIAVNKLFVLVFDNLVNVDTAIGHLSSVPNMKAIWRGMPRFNRTYVPSDKGLKPNIDFDEISLNSSSKFNPKLHELGWQWNLYNIKCPMAWEITKGKSTIHIIGFDGFGGTVSSNPDLTPNFIQLVDNSPGTGQRVKADGLLTFELKSGHGHSCISQAIAVIGGGPMVGTCPNCKGMALGGSYMVGGVLVTPMPHNIDVDGTSNGVQVVPEIQWSSMSGPSDDDFKSSMASGIAVFSGAGNTLDCSDCGQNSNYQTNPSNSSQTLLYPQVLDWPGYTAFIDGGSDPSKDVHPLSVAGTMDGHLFGPSGGSLCVEHVGGANVFSQGLEEFVINLDFIPYNFSCGLDKFSLDPDITTRIQRKQWAFSDIVAPARLLLDANTLAAGYDITDGTSLSAPMVAGIGGLMRSVNYWVSPTNTKPTDLADVQRNINTIMTFTADKIADYDNIGSHTFPNSKVIPKAFPTTGDDQYDQSIDNDASLASGMPSWLDPQAAGAGDWQYDYEPQSNDVLGRTWAQRVGFGRINAYRAVAHSIPKKGDYEYTAGTTLSFDVNVKNEDNRPLMHFGAWKNSSTSSVLAVGGNSIPGQSHNNQGETLLNSSSSTPILLLVATSMVGGTSQGNILAIDGLLRQTASTLRANKIATIGNGKILMEGYLENVALEGNLKISDLIINSTTTDGYGAIIPSPNSTNTAEIYGTVSLMNYGKITFVMNKTLYLMAGGGIDVSGSIDLTINAGSLVMRGASKIHTSSSRQVIVGKTSSPASTAKLFCGANEGDDVEIDGMVTVTSGSELHVTAGCTLRIKDFLIEKGGEMIIHPGARVILTEDEGEYVCNGTIYFDGGTGDDEIHVTASEGCANPVGDDVTGTAALLVEGEVYSNSSPDASLFHATHTNFENVVVKLIDVAKDPIENCTFTANNNFDLLPGASKHHLLEINNPDAVNFPLLNVITASFESCTFSFTGTNPIVKSITRGLLLKRVQSHGSSNGLEMNNCQFNDLDGGIGTQESSICQISTSQIDDCITGITADDSHLILCSNTLSDGVDGFVGEFVTLDAYDNLLRDFTNTCITLGSAADFVGVGRFRGNTFRNYGISGLKLQNNVGHLEGALPIGGGDYLVFGRNVFEYVGGYTGGGGTTSDIELISDALALVDETVDAKVVCGFNKFNPSTTYHISLNTGHSRTIAGTKNNWLTGATPRKTANISIPGISSDFDDHLSVSPLCGEFVTDEICYDGDVSSSFSGEQKPQIIEQTTPEPIKAVFVAERNPFTDDILLKVGLDGSSMLSLSIFDELGKMRYSEPSYLKEQGEYHYTISTKGWAEGVYFARLKSGNTIQTIKLIKK